MSAVFVLIGAVAIIAVVTVAIFGEETKGRTLEAITAQSRRVDLGAQSRMTL